MGKPHGTGAIASLRPPWWWWGGHCCWGQHGSCLLATHNQHLCPGRCPLRAGGMQTYVLPVADTANQRGFRRGAPCGQHRAIPAQHRLEVASRGRASEKLGCRWRHGQSPRVRVPPSPLRPFPAAERAGMRVGKLGFRSYSLGFNVFISEVKVLKSMNYGVLLPNSHSVTVPGHRWGQHTERFSFSHHC